MYFAVRKARRLISNNKTLYSVHLYVVGVVSHLRGLQSTGIRLHYYGLYFDSRNLKWTSTERVVKTLYQQTDAFITKLAIFLSYDGRPQYSRATPPGHDSNRNQTETFLTSRTKESL